MTNGLEALAQSDAKPVAWQSQVRREVASFALLMERELRNNDHKPGWKEGSPDTLAQRVVEEAAELLAVASLYEAVALSPVPKQTAERVASEAADVANMAMMVADVCGMLPPLDATLVQSDAKPDASAGLIEADNAKLRVLLLAASKYVADAGSDEDPETQCCSQTLLASIRAAIRARARAADGAGNE